MPVAREVFVSTTNKESNKHMSWGGTLLTLSKRVVCDLPSLAPALPLPRNAVLP